MRHFWPSWPHSEGNFNLLAQKIGALLDKSTFLGVHYSYRYVGFYMVQKKSGKSGHPSVQCLLARKEGAGRAGTFWDIWPPWCQTEWRLTVFSVGGALHHTGWWSFQRQCFRPDVHHNEFWMDFKQRQGLFNCPLGFSYIFFLQKITSLSAVFSFLHLLVIFLNYTLVW